ncbi:hypothetical protein IID20_03685 [Patescibacteria group bacterium]|nr:hypothetical protein [Patescibacteria group bacterium]
MSENNKQKFGKYASAILIFILIISFGSLSLQTKADLVFKEIRQWQIASDAIAIQNDATENNCTNISTCAVTLNVPATATMVVVAVAVRDAETITSVSDSNGDTYTIAYSQGTDPTVAIYYNTTITANAAKTITANLSAGTADTVIDAYTLTGTATSSPIDATATNSGSSSTLNANITTNTAGSLIAYVAGMQTNGTQSTYGTDQFQRGQIAQGGNPKYAAANTSEITTGAGGNDQTSTASKSAAWRAIAVEIKVAPANAVPVVSNVVINNNANFSPVPAGVIGITISGQVVDDDGCSDMNVFTGQAFVTIDNNINCAADNNDCYVGLSCQTSCTGTVADVSCVANIEFYAEPTDDDADEWVGAILMTDGSNATDEAVSDTAQDVEYTGALCISVIPASIAYGTLAPGGDSGSDTRSTLVANVCNTAMDVSLSGTDMTEPVSYTIIVTEQQYGTETFTYDGAGQDDLATGGANVEIDALKPTASPTNSSDEIFWGIGIPSAAVDNTEYGGVNTFTAIND